MGVVFGSSLFMAVLTSNSRFVHGVKDKLKKLDKHTDIYYAHLKKQHIYTSFLEKKVTPLIPPIIFRTSYSAGSVAARLCRSHKRRSDR